MFRAASFSGHSDLRHVSRLPQSLRCPEFLRHKNNMVMPSRFLENHVSVYRCVQERGEFVVTAPR